MRATIARMSSRPKSAAVLVPAVVILLAAGLRLWDLSYPTHMYWDEQYYVFDAEAYIGGGIGIPVGHPPPDTIADEGTWVHPPLGKWIIAVLGVGPLGLRAIGWRLPSAVFGVAGVALLYFLALELWGSVWRAGLAGLLLALDGLHIVQSRMAMLDIFLTTFMTAGMLLLVLDRKRAKPVAAIGRGPEPMVVRVFGSPYRLGAGLAFGAAVATKWTGLLALLLAAALCAFWQTREPTDGSAWRWRSLRTVAASFLLAPLLVYLISYGAFFYQHGPAIRAFLTLQMAMLRYHLTHTKIQPENSLPLTWPILLHPIQYFRASAGGSPARSSRSETRRSGGPSSLSCRSRCSASREDPPGRTPSPSAATPSRTCPGSRSPGPSSSSTCCPRSPSCAWPSLVASEGFPRESKGSQAPPPPRPWSSRGGLSRRFGWGSRPRRRGSNASAGCPRGTCEGRVERKTKERPEGRSFLFGWAAGYVQLRFGVFAAVAAKSPVQVPRPLPYHVPLFAGVVVSIVSRRP